MTTSSDRQTAATGVSSPYNFSACQRINNAKHSISYWTLLVLCLVARVSMAFVSPSTQQRYVGRDRALAFLPTSSKPETGRSNTELNTFMGSDGGILGIGTPELFTILLVGYFVLGPSDLYKLTKEIGKFVQNFRTFTTEATSSIENNLESQLQLEEIRKAQRELNDAFSFRRSINVEADTDPFEVNAQSPREEATAVAAAEGAATTTKKKIRRRRVKKKVVEPVEEEDPFCVSDINGDVNQGPVENNIPEELSMDDELSESEEKAAQAMREANEALRQEAMEEEAAQRRKERMERLQQAGAEDTEEAEAASARFQAQMSGNWNDSILEKGDELSPLASIMDRLALLEEEKQAADERLQEEFRVREENEERFYREKRKLLEDAAAEIQAAAYTTTTNTAAVAESSSNTTAVATEA